jgi:2-iminobutanoate/2-iminopropanoate deaminase
MLPGISGFFYDGQNLSAEAGATMAAVESVVEIYGPSTRDPIPWGVRIGDIVYSARLTGLDPTSGLAADDVERQMEQALRNMTGLVEKAGASLDSVGRVTFFVGRLEDREPVYGPWDRLFPDPQDRPAAKALVADLPPGEMVRLHMVALAGARRQRIDIPGVPARDPTVKLGHLLFTSRVHGTDPSTGKASEGFEPQAERAFRNILTLAELAGGSAASVRQITVFLANPAYAQPARQHFERTFPANGRPSLHVMEAFIPPHLDIMVEMTGVL